MAVVSHIWHYETQIVRYKDNYTLFEKGQKGGDPPI